MMSLNSERRLYWITNHYTYYHDYLFHHIKTQGTYNLVVCFKQLVLDSHPWKEIESENYTMVEMVHGPLDLDWKLLWKALFGTDDFVVGGWDNLMYLVLITILRIRNRPFAVFSDTPKKPILNLSQKIKKQWLHFIFSSKSKGKLLVTGEVGVKRSLEYFQLNTHQVINFPFVTNHAKFCPLSSGIQFKTDVPIVFLAVGRIDFNHKGQDVALHALAKLTRRGRKNFRYRIAGLGEDLERMKTLTTDLGLDDYVEHFGWVEIQDLPRLINEAHFVLHTSHEDPFPNSVLESLSCGVPVIASEAAGSAYERVHNGINGFLFPDGDIVELEKILQIVLDMPEAYWLEMKAQCRQLALQWPADYNLKVINQLFPKYNS